jgi:hypothetical protein
MEYALALHNKTVYASPPLAVGGFFFFILRARHRTFKGGFFCSVGAGYF